MPTKTLDYHYAITPRLLPGAGWSGATPTPSAVGNSGAAAGYSENAIARWSHVPYQTFAVDTFLGCAAFHMEGIDRVEFAVDGGAWRPVATMTYNSQSGG